jgi:hypothetical protein
MDEIEVKVTWRFAWALYWRMLLMGLGISVVIWLIMLIVATVIGGNICPYL